MSGRNKRYWAREPRIPTLEELDWLRSDEGGAVCAAMAAGEAADTPAAIAKWRQRLSAEHVTAAWTQVTLRAAARAKFSRADAMLFDRVGLEQATDEVIAAHKARRFAGCARVVDFCCGIGGDAMLLAAECEVVALDRLAARVAMTEHNACAYGRLIVPLIGDAAIERPDADAVHIDPDRRPGGSRRHEPDASSPDVDVLQQIVGHYPRVAIKLSPGAEFDALPFDVEIELISHHGECKQAVAWTEGFKQTYRRATVLPGGESISGERDSLAWPNAEPIVPGRYLFEPDGAVIRANLVGSLSRQFGVAPVDEHIAYLIGEQIHATSLMKAFRIIDTMDWSMPRARPWLAKHDVGQLDVKTRGFAARPEEILQRLKLTGTRGAVLFLTRVGDRPTAILAERI